MKLKALLQGVDIIQMNADPELEISEVAYDSRKATRGCLFVAIAGFASDGNRFIPMAREKGAAVVVTAKQPEEDIPYVLVASDRLALSRIGCNYYGEPAKRMTMIGVTGTNGKTTVTLLVKHILEQTKNVKVGLIGTVANQIGSVSVATERTTPESFELQGLFAKMLEAGCGYVVMEVSSHAIALERVGGVHYDVAAFTNLTEDHLDFHKTMQRYCETKAKLFRRCDRAVLNGDDAYYPAMRAQAQCPILTFSAHDGADLCAQEIETLPDGVRFTACYRDERVRVSMPIPGRFSVYNALTAIGIALSLGIPLAAAAQALASVAGVPGRVEVVPTPGKPYTVLIDYAHTPDGLQNVLTSVREICRGRVIAVFGCGGDRDPIKRPIMGRIGVENADIAIITSDNPRTEEPMAIIDDIVAGVPEGKENYTIIENRPRAIAHALDIAQKDDIIVLAGKGHETYQEICGVKHHMDEREIVAHYLSEMGDNHE